jgi:hypothetical protein
MINDPPILSPGATPTSPVYTVVSWPLKDTAVPALMAYLEHSPNATSVLALVVAAKMITTTDTAEKIMLHDIEVVGNFFEVVSLI